MSFRPTFKQYKALRSEFFDSEQSQAIGSQLKLNDRENVANEFIKLLKKKELENGFADPQNFTGARHIFRSLNAIGKSKLFQLIQKMPKGGVLHAHDTALTSLDTLLSFSYWPNLWQCHNSQTDDLAFIFAKNRPDARNGVHWTLVSDEREKLGKVTYDQWLRKNMSLWTDNPDSEYSDINHIWERFIGIFGKVTPILTYVPVWKEYYKRALKEFLADGVQYLEFRATLDNLYDLNGNIYKEADVVKVYIDALEEFKTENPDFIDSKVIYAPSRQVDDARFSEYMKTVVDIKARYPNFVAGFDIVTQEDLGRPLTDFTEQILALPDSIDFFFHAGETNWNGMKTDENMIDAILLGTKRIGHGFAVLKHPKVLKAVKERNIAIEINAISNQVLKLVEDHRNHPAAHLFAAGYPVVVSSDDPSFWGTLPLSHDFYVSFVGIASAHADLKMLKQLAMNSLNYSAMNENEKRIAFDKWQTKWNQFIEWVIEEGKKS